MRILVLAFALAVLTAVSILIRYTTTKYAVAAQRIDRDFRAIAGGTEKMVKAEFQKPGQALNETTAATSRHMETMQQEFSRSIVSRINKTSDAIAVLCTLVLGAIVFLLCLGVWFALHNERVLANSERRYRDLIENALVGVLVYKHGRIRFVNETVARWSGYDRRELLGRPILDFVHPEDRPMARERMERRQRGENVPNRYELRLVKKDGGVVWIDLWVRSPQSGTQEAVTTNLVDITDRRMAQEELRKSEQKFRTFTEKSLHPIWVMQDDRVVYCNSAFGFYVGVDDRAEVTGRALADFVDDRDAEDVQTAVDRVRSGEVQFQRILARFVTVNETMRWHDVQLAGIEYEQRPAILASGQDVTELKMVMDQLDQERLRDGLTGLYNRRYFNECVLEDLESADDAGDRFTVLSLDVDRLKTVNDTFGHAAGDIVLTEVADVLVEQVRSDDTVMRIGGDEFLIIMADTAITDTRGVQKRLQSALRRRLRRRATEGTLAPEIPQLVGLSAGAAEYRTGDNNSFEETLQIADRRMYAQKQAENVGRDHQIMRGKANGRN